MNAQAHAGATGARRDLSALFHFESGGASPVCLRAQLYNATVVVAFGCTCTGFDSSDRPLSRIV